MGLCGTPHRRVSVGLWTHLIDQDRDVLLLASPKDVNNNNNNNNKSIYVLLKQALCFVDFSPSVTLDSNL